MWLIFCYGSMRASVSFGVDSYAHADPMDSEYLQVLVLAFWPPAKNHCLYSYILYKTVDHVYLVLVLWSILSSDSF